MDSNKRDEIEKLLNELPDIMDNRSKEDVISRLKQDERLQKPLKNKIKQKKRTNWVVAFVGIASILVLSLLLSSMLNRSTDKASESADTISEKLEMFKDDSDDVTTSTASDQEAESSKEISVVGENEINDSMSIEEDAGTHFAVYPEELGDDTVFHLGLAGDAATSVPVTFIIPKSQIEEDFGKVKPTSFDLYEKYASQIDEEALGFTDYHPYKGKLTVDGEALVQTLPEGHGYDIASATMEIFINTLNDTFYGFHEVRFENEDETIVEFDQVGELSKPMRLMSGHNKYNYYVVRQENGQPFLSSNFGKSYERLDVALEEMKTSPNDIYSAIIPSKVNFKLVEDAEVSVVKFEEPLDLESMNDQDARLMIDGILLTAASFDVQLQFENVVQSEWGGLNFKKPLPIPVGPNQMPLLLN